MPDLGVIASLVAVPLALATVVFAYLTWREARATVKPLRLMAEEQQEALAQQRAQRRLAQLEMALQSQQADALPRCRELVRDIRLDAVHLSPADTVMPALSEIEAALQATARG
jgi:type IV secretory pathway TrbF-like protein